MLSLFFFFNDTATTEIYTLSLHDALPISSQPCTAVTTLCFLMRSTSKDGLTTAAAPATGRSKAMRRSLRPGLRSEEHTSELQSRLHLVCRLLLEKKKN